MPHNFACRVQAVNLLVANSLEYETYHWQPCARFVNPNIRYLVIYLYLGQGITLAAALFLHRELLQKLASIASCEL